ncbi:hypothetical protein NDU88_000554 [Pleurodeles waltl]|uniref:Uncharacterized protein n=1 Tax=Pleurodeles waltl TaxID=8319 RepID=A0AAV7U4K1_PLEWA|nr:hypothetical protein NDU88_000554 [Pleurodeles waltl]
MNLLKEAGRLDLVVDSLVEKAHARPVRWASSCEAAVVLAWSLLRKVQVAGQQQGCYRVLRRSAPEGSRLDADRMLRLLRSLAWEAPHSDCLERACGGCGPGGPESRAREPDPSPLIHK